MQMLAAGGMPLLTDGIRQSDDDNPAGYFEFEPVKRIRSDASWVPSAVGKAVKVIYMLLADLPLQFTYRVIFMRRDVDEVVSSQQAMLQRRRELGADVDAEEMARIFERQLAKTEEWLAGQPAFTALFLNYRDVINDPGSNSARIRDFLGIDLNTSAMSAVVSPKLYRQRKTKT
jgi:hypothetical protein